MISTDMTRFGVVRFGNQANTVVRLGADTNINSLQQSIEEIQHVTQSSSNTAAGITTALQEFRLNGRRNVPRVMLIFTNGISNNPTQTAAAALDARADGIQLFSIGIGGNVLQSELQAIASDPDEVHIFNVADFASFDAILGGLVQETCNGENCSLKEVMHCLIFSIV